MAERFKQACARGRIMIVCTLVILLLLGGFEYIPLASGNDLQLLSLLSSQEWVSQRIVKDVLIMDAGTTVQRTQAVNELQNELPFWENNQTAIKNGNVAVEIQVLFASTNADFTSMDTAAKKILATPDRAPDPVELQIVLDHERAYFINETQMVNIIQQKMLLRTQWLFGIEITLGALVFAGEAWRLVIVEQLVRAIKKEAEKKGDTV
jgi:hypothetical protein